MSTVANFTLEQYERMVEAGAFDGRLHQHVEFIRGEIREMNPIGSFHSQVVTDITDWSYSAAQKNEITIRVQATLRIPLLNCAPEPDVLWVRRGRYSRKNPEPADVLLVIEVAESSISTDRGEKLELYAAAGIREYWIANLIDFTIEVYRDPTQQSYSYARTYGSGESIAPLVAPAAPLAVDYLFPK
jgi:Uma2 family endonuclease